MKEKIRKSLQLTEQHVGDHITMQDIARSVFLSPRHFYRLFKIHTGAENTVVDSKYAEYLRLTLRKDSTSFTGTGGQGLEVIPSAGNRIEIGRYAISDFTLLVMSPEHDRRALAQVGASEAFSGVVGVDILKPARRLLITAP